MHLSIFLQLLKICIISCFFYRILSLKTSPPFFFPPAHLWDVLCFSAQKAAQVREQLLNNIETQPVLMICALDSAKALLTRRLCNFTVEKSLVSVLGVCQDMKFLLSWLDIFSNITNKQSDSFQVIYIYIYIYIYICI